LDKGRLLHGPGCEATPAALLQDDVPQPLATVSADEYEGIVGEVTDLDLPLDGDRTGAQAGRGSREMAV